MGTNFGAFCKIFAACLYLGVSTASLLYVITFVPPMREVVSKMGNMIKECESNIPRNIHCELRADIKESE